MLAVTPYGTPSRQPPLLIAHGLFGSARNWGVIAKRLSDTRQILCVDMRNHGDSPRADTQTYSDMAADLAEVIDGHADGHADLLGHSMGGKAAMVLASTASDKLNRLIIGDIAPVGYSHSQSHLIAAMRALDLNAATTRSEADALLTQTIPEPGIRAFLLQSLDLRSRTWKLNLDVLEQFMADIIGFPPLTAAFTRPTLFLSGATSDYVLPEHRALIKPLFPKARFAKIPGAGHWLHAEKPREFEASVRAFLDA